MRVIIDADACPVVKTAAAICKEYHIECIAVCDTSHILSDDGVVVITVSKGADSADWKIANLAGKEDIVVTQDYGLAALCVEKCYAVLNQNGMIYDNDNIEYLLFARYESKKIRMSGGKTKGPKKRKKEQDRAFESQLRELILKKYK